MSLWQAVTIAKSRYSMLFLGWYRMVLGGAPLAYSAIGASYSLNEASYRRSAPS